MSKGRISIQELSDRLIAEIQKTGLTQPEVEAVVLGTTGRLADLLTGDKSDLVNAINELIGSKSNNGHTHEESEVDLAKYATIDSVNTGLDTKSNTNHNHVEYETAHKEIDTKLGDHDTELSDIKSLINTVETGLKNDVARTNAAVEEIYGLLNTLTTRVDALENIQP